MAHAGYPVGRGAALLVELDGAERECEARFEEVVAVCERCGSDDVRVARDEAERQLFWKTRKAAFPAMGRISPELLRAGRRDPAHQAARGAGGDRRAGGGVRHGRRQRLPRRRRQPAPARLLRRRATRARPSAPRSCPGRILDACLDAGGSITGEHGVGVDKKKHMPKMFGEPDLDAFQRLRCAFDPRGLANPGKVMPTPRLCGEVPGRLPPAPARGGRAGGAVLRPGTRGGGRGAAAPLGEEGRPVRPRGGGTKPWGPPTRRRRRVETGGLEPHPRAQRRRLHGGARGRRAARRGAGRRSPSTARCSRSTRRCGDARDDRRDHRDRRLRPAAPPLRRACATSSSARRSRSRTGRSRSSGGKVIKNVAGYDLGEALHRLVRHARADRRGSRCGCTRCPPRTATAVGASDDPDAARRGGASRSPRRPLEADCLDVDWRDGAGRLLVRFGAPRPAHQAAATVARMRALGLERRAVIEDDDELWRRQRGAPARRRAC